MEKKFHLSDYGYEVTFGKFAGQANGAAWLQQGGTIVLATVCSAKSTDFPGFLPLSVDYREQYAAAGKIPGGYFKREGKFTDAEVLTARGIDRAIRPLFPDNYFDAVQVSVTVYSVDKEHVPEPLALLAASLALEVSDIPFLGPVGAVEAVRIGDQWIFQPNFDQIQQTTTHVVIAGDEQGICMVEGTAAFMGEQEFVDCMFAAHEIIQKQVAWQKSIAKELRIEKKPVHEFFDIASWQDRARAYLKQQDIARMFSGDKVIRSAVQSEFNAQFLATYAQEIAAEGVSSTFLTYIFEKILRDSLIDECFARQQRIDGRSFTTVRPIDVEVGILPYNHGSALFTRGRTQALVSATLGGGQDELKVDRLMGDTRETSFMLHYNFPPFSVGEVRASRGPGRREIGHGYLAASAIEQVCPSKKEFPYTIRIVADMLESDGSTSMATVCGSTMALMDAGVPISDMVSGVAMGLLKNSQGEYQVLTDIAGIEDAFGLMDFKVAGTKHGITAIQMDIKHKGGLPRELFLNALEQARQGRMHILSRMEQVMTAPRKQVSSLVPQIVSFPIPVEKIGAVIGSGGKVIKDIIAKTGASIDIADEGTVRIYGRSGQGLEQAVLWVKVIAGQIEKGMVFDGIVKRSADFGVFVEIAPGVDGLVHISTIARPQQEAVMKSIASGQPVKVQVLDYESDTGRIRLKLL